VKNRLYWIIGLLAGSSFLVGFLISSQLPKLERFILVKVETLSSANSPVKVLPAAVDLNLFPLGASLKKVRIVPKEEISQFVDPLEIEEIKVSVSLWQLLQGRLRISSVGLRGSSVTARVPKTEKKSAKPLDGLFNIVAQIPVSHLKIEDVNVHLTLTEPKMSVDIENLTLDTEKRRNGLALNLEDTKIHIFDPDTKSAALIEADADLVATRDQVTVNALKLRRGDSFIVGSGHAKGDTEALLFKDGTGSLRAEVQIESMRNWFVKTFPRLKKVPPLKGHLFLEAKAKQGENQKARVDFEARTDRFQVFQIILDKLQTKGSFHFDKDTGVIETAKLKLENAAGSAEVDNLSLHFDERKTIQGNLNVVGIQVRELMKLMDLPKVPMWAQISGSTPCHGAFLPDFEIKCQGSVKGSNVVLKSDLQILKNESANTIVELKDFSANGEFTIGEEAVNYSTELSMANSKGRSHGSINYESGFKIDYEADRLSMSDITHLVNLKIEGNAKIKGHTEGGSQTAWTTMNLDGTDMWLEDYWLGNAKTDLTYKAGFLTFADLQGYYTVSRYAGDVRLDLPNKKIAMAGRMPFFDTRDFLKVFSRRVTLPFTVTGTGLAQAHVSGPLQFNLLSYDLKSTVFKGSVAGETFDQAHFDVKSVNGEVKAERVQISKGSANITLNGEAHPNADVKAVVHGRGIRLEDTVLIAKSGLAVSGAVDFDLDLSRYILAPDAILNGTLTKTSIGDQAMPDSSFKLKFNKRSLEGAGHLLGDVVTTEFIYPYDATAPFKLKVLAKDWNFAPVFAVLAGPATRRDYESRLSCDIDLASPSGGFWNATGPIRIGKFLLSRGSLALKSSEPLLMSMNNGQMHVQKFQMGGEGTYLKVSENKNPGSKIDLQAIGKLDLNLLAFLTPFFEDMRGLLSFTFAVHGGSGTNELLGSAYLEKGYLKFFNFPHAFEDVRADLLFNQHKIMFNTLKAEFGGGRVVGTGGMELKGYKNFPVSVAGTFDKITMIVPENIKTTGSGDFTFTGNWFPFLLKGTYNISDGLYAKEFSGGAASDGIRRDTFLPDALVEENVPPLNVDFTIGLQKGLAVKNEIIDGSVQGQIYVHGNPTKPAIGGNIILQKDTKLSFKDNIFEVSASNIQFTDSTEISPKLYIAAAARVQSYDVNLLVQGTGTKPVYTLTSVPPLVQKDIVSLLAFGATDSDFDKKISSDQQAQSTGLQVGSGMIKNNFVTDQIKKTFGFDVQFSPGFDDTGSATQKIIATRQFTPNLGLSASQSFGKSRDTETRVKYRLNERLSLIGSWQGKDNTDETATNTLKTDYNPNTVGADLEFKFGFK
jgi:translocation and assembly module TamB